MNYHGRIEPRTTKLIVIGPPLHFYSQESYIYFYSVKENEDGTTSYGKEGRFPIKTEHYFYILKNAKKYLPTFILTQDKDGLPILSGPTDEKSLQEAIEKVKQTEIAKINKKVCEAVPQLPTGAGKGIPNIIGEYALEPE